MGISKVNPGYFADSTIYWNSVNIVYLI